MVFGKEGKHFAIQGDAGFFQLVDEVAVRQIVGAYRGVDADGPQTAHVAFLAAAVDVRIFTRLEHRGACKLNFGLAAPHHSFGLPKKIAATLGVLRSAFYAWHMSEREKLLVFSY